MINKIKSLLFFLIFVSIHFNCKGHKKAEHYSLPNEKVTVIIPFMPGDCHQCNDAFYKNLKTLDNGKGGILFLIPDNYSDDLDHIKKTNRLEDYKNEQFIFSSALFNKYRIYEQSFVLQFGSDSNYKIYNNAKTLIEDLEQLPKADIMDLGDHKIKKSTEYILAKNKEQMCILNSLHTSAFDYLDLRDGKKVHNVTFNEEQLLRNFILNFKDTGIAKSKLSELEQVNDIPNKDRFEQIEFVNDSIFASSSHTYIANLKDSILGGFFSINIYKDGKYIDSRSISNEYIPRGYMIIPKFHVYNGSLYVKVVKERLEADDPNYFLAKFELENGVYKFKKMLSFVLPAINNDVGYVFTDLKFSGKYFVNPISNLLYDLGSEQSVALNIPVNEKFVYADLVSGFKGVNIIISDVNVQFPNVLIKYFSTDVTGRTTNVLLNYNLQNKNIEGKVQMPEDRSMFLTPDLSRFGYYIWLPEKGNYGQMVYKKLF